MRQGRIAGVSTIQPQSADSLASASLRQDLGRAWSSGFTGRIFLSKQLQLVVSVSGLFIAGCSGAHVTFRCDSGRTVEAAYTSDDTAMVRYQGETRRMRLAVSGSGARYADDALEWWTKGSGPGSEGTLFRQQTDGTTGEIIERCSQVQ